MDNILRRHIQNFSDAASLEPHWGYADRAIPCKNDPGSCQYLDLVYHAHDLGMLYSGIIWVTVGGALMVWLLIRLSRNTANSLRVSTQAVPTQSSPKSQGSLERLLSSVSALSRSVLLPESFRPIFGHTTRLQILILAVLVSYLTIWSFVGISYKKWITPVKNSSLHNTRTSLGPFADRMGLLAFALMPFSIMLSSRESILSLATGIPYQHFNFLHRWLGYVIFVQSIVHALSWTIIEAVLYQPQPKTGKEWITERYMIWGIVAQTFIIFIFISSLSPVVKLTGYEFFRKAHYIVAMLFLGACWAHWSNLSCFMIASLVVWFLDRGVRLGRTALLHYNYGPAGIMGFISAKAKISHFPDERNGDIIRLDFEHAQNAWFIGQHFYLCFPEISMWQSHPFTPVSIPSSGGVQQHSYVIRSKRGETKNLVPVATQKMAAAKISVNEENLHDEPAVTPVILAGPYGGNIMAGLGADTNILCIAGGTGITYVLPVLLSLTSATTQRPFPLNRKIDLVWAVRMENDVSWVEPELKTLERAAKRTGLNVHIYVTRECCTTSAAVSAGAMAAKDSIKHLVSQTQETDSTSSPTSISSDGRSSSTRHSARPDLQTLTRSFIEGTVCGSTTVFASGPSGMISDLRTAVAQCNDAGKVWKGDRRWDVRLICDNRLEW